MHYSMLVCFLWLIVHQQVMSEVKYEYFSPGNTKILNCKAKSNCIYWNGPAFNETSGYPMNVSDIYGDIKEWRIDTYASNNKTNPNLDHRNRIKIEKSDGTFNLVIKNTSKNDAGLYACEEGLNVTTRKLTLLQMIRRPSDLTFHGITGKSTVDGTENQNITISCTETNALPPSKLSLLRNNETVLSNAIGSIIYTIKLKRTDDILRCKLENSYWNTTEVRDIFLHVQYKPDVNFSNKTVKMIEGTTVTLCCNAVSSPSIRIIKILHGRYVVNTTKDKPYICHHFHNLSRYDNGIYECVARNDIGKGNASIKVTVMYAPKISITQYINENGSTILRCDPTGNPSTYNYSFWEHRSFLGEHIRYLNKGNAKLTLPNKALQERYQDSGIYTCNASNNVVDLRGKLFQQGHFTFKSQSPPFLLPGNKEIQNGTIGIKGIIELDFVSYFPISCQELHPIETQTKDFHVIHNIMDITASAVYHNVSVQVKASKVMFVMKHLQQKQFQRYIVTVCNQYGNLSFEIDLIQVETGQTMRNKTITTITLVVIVILISFLLMFVTLYLLVKRRWTRSGSAAVDIEIEGNFYAIENRLYNGLLNGQIPDSNANLSPGSTLLFDTTNHDRSAHGTLSQTTEELGQSEEGQLNYADVVFDATSANQERAVRPVNNRSQYADIDPTRVGQLPDPSSSSSSSENDFMYLQGIENYIERRREPFL